MYIIRKALSLAPMLFRGDSFAINFKDSVFRKKVLSHCLAPFEICPPDTLIKGNNQGFPGGAVVENLPADAGDTGSSPGLGRSHMPRSN